MDQLKTTEFIQGIFTLVVALVVGFIIGLQVPQTPEKATFWTQHADMQCGDTLGLREHRLMLMRGGLYYLYRNEDGEFYLISKEEADERN